MSQSCYSMQNNQFIDEKIELDLETCTCGGMSYDGFSAVEYDCSACCLKYNGPAKSNFFLFKPICFIYNFFDRVMLKYALYYTPLHHAVWLDRKKMAFILISECFFNPDHTSSSLTTPLGYAALRKNKNFVLWLVQKHSCCVNSIDSNGFSILYIAVMAGSKKMVNFLLRSGATIFSQNTKSSPLYRAIIDNNYLLVKALFRWLFTLANMPIQKKLRLSCSVNTHKPCKHPIRTNTCVTSCTRTNKHFKQEAILFLLVLNCKFKNKSLPRLPKPVVGLILLHNTADEQAQKIWASVDSVTAVYQSMKELFMMKLEKDETILDFVQKKGFKEIEQLFCAILNGDSKFVVAALLHD